MDGRAVALAIPLFFLLIGVELLADKRRRARGEEPLYRFADSIASLSCGVGQQVLQALALTALGVATYDFVWERARLFDLSASSPLTWIVAFVVVDLCYWVYHWASHRVNFFWAMHVVHHSSEEFNLSTALRQSWFTNLTSWVFYLPLALLGVPALVFVLCLTLNILYQFWIHTRLVKKLGAFEIAFNTPSHHRVHHGIDPAYIDKNYAGVFIVWDKLFGTFTEEKDEPNYGTVKPLSSFNPFWANVDLFAHLASMSRRTSRLRDKILVWIMPPEWHPADLGGVVTVPEVDRATRVKHRPSKDGRHGGYIVGQFAFVSALMFGLLWMSASLSAVELAAGGALVMTALAVWGGLLELKRWAVPLEAARLLALAVAGALWIAGGGAAWAGAAAVLVACGSAVWLAAVGRRSVGARMASPA